VSYAIIAVNNPTPMNVSALWITWENILGPITNVVNIPASYSPINPNRPEYSDFPHDNKESLGYI